jgi:hypothetical protein
MSCKIALEKSGNSQAPLSYYNSRTFDNFTAILLYFLNLH